MQVVLEGGRGAGGTGRRPWCRWYCKEAVVHIEHTL